MVIGSHNSWTYAEPRKWWMKLLAFTAKCQKLNIREQYLCGVRCFDLRIKINKDKQFTIAHGIIEYKYSFCELLNDLQYLDSKKDTYVRVLHEVRSEKEYNEESIEAFSNYCRILTLLFEDIKFWNGRNLYDNRKDFVFNTKDLNCDDKYASVDYPKIIDDWWPWIYAYRNNKKIIKNGTDKDVLLIDFVDYEY